MSPVDCTMVKGFEEKGLNIGSKEELEQFGEKP